jgi:hypothetical protein
MAECAGWQSPPEARLDCCKDRMCPLRHREAGTSRAPVTQAAADDSCAQSQDQESNQDQAFVTDARRTP